MNPLPQSFLDSRLPDNKRCLDCSNYKPLCRQELAGDKPFDGNQRYCYFGPAHLFFNVDISKPSEFIKLRRKSR